MEVVVGNRMGCGWVDIILVTGVAAEQNGAMRGRCMRVRRERWHVKESENNENGKEKEKEKGRRSVIVRIATVKEKLSEIEQGITVTGIGSIKNMSGRDNGIIIIFSSSIDRRLYMVVVGLLHLKDQV